MSLTLVRGTNLIMKEQELKIERDNSERSKSEWRITAKQAFKQITGREPGDFNEIIYLSSEFRDSQGRSVNFRLYELGKGEFMLYENAGDPLALLELRDRFEQEGIPISKLQVQASERTPEIEKALGLSKLCTK